MQQTANLLVVDDEPELCEIPVEYFTGQGFDIRSAGDAVAAREAFGRQVPDLAILDIRMPLPKISLGPEDGMIRLAPFFDFGAAWNTDRQDFGPDTLPSLGVGLRWDPSAKLHADVYWGYAFQDFVVQGSDLQDDGISFRIELDVF